MSATASIGNGTYTLLCLSVGVVVSTDGSGDDNNNRGRRRRRGQPVIDRGRARPRFLRERLRRRSDGVGGGTTTYCAAYYKRRNPRPAEGIHHPGGAVLSTSTSRPQPVIGTATAYVTPRACSAPLIAKLSVNRPADACPGDRWRGVE